MLPRVAFVVLVSVFAIVRPAYTQSSASISVEVRFNAMPVPDVLVVVNGTAHMTDAEGRLTVAVVPGSVEVVAVTEGFAPAMTTVSVQPGQTQSIVVELQKTPTVEEQVVVSATRTDKRLEDQPMRVEVLAREEIEEKMLMTPGDIVMMLNEMGGMRVQTTSPSLGAASVRIQGMRGRYTRFFSDGLPLFGEVGGLGLLQIPPMDLGQVEVIKGVASSLYGAGAMGGVVNLISRRPGAETQRELLVNRSTRGGTDAVAWFATPAQLGWAFTLMSGGHWQQRVDVNDDTWSDLPGYTRGLIRPRVFWDGGNGRTFFATAGFTGEERTGGGSPQSRPYQEALGTRRADAGAVAQILLRQRYLVSARAAVMQQRHDHQFGDIRERDRHETTFAEMTIRASAGRNTLVGGFAFERDAYRPRDVPRFAYTFTVPGVFVQEDIDLTRWLSLSASGRLDHHSEFGVFFSPRVSGFVRAGRWTSRLSLGTGFFGASPLTEETEATGLSRLVVPRRLRAEEGRSSSLDLSRTDGPLSYTLTFFGSRVRNPVDVDRSNGLLLTNLAEATTNVGVELLGTLRQEPYALTATYTYVQARELDEGVRAEAPLTPRHSAGIVGMREREDVGRVGIEIYYTGAQRLEQNPFRAQSRPYVILGLLAERQYGRVRVFMNGENLTGVRQTRWDPLIRPSQAPDGRWTVDAWAPLEGRNVNGGVRLRF
jgi:outer membrane receptor for ferrienterochelin and colicins